MQPGRLVAASLGALFLLLFGVGQAAADEEVHPDGDIPKSLDEVSRQLDNPLTSLWSLTLENKAFIKEFKEMWGDDIVVGDVTNNAYLGPWLWKAAVEKAGSFDIDKVKLANPGIEMKNAPEGYVRIHETNHHL